MKLNKHYFVLFVALITMIVVSAGCTETPSASPITAAETPSPDVTATPSIPNIVGVWKVTMIGHTAEEGFRESKTSCYNITEQKGQSFTGYKVYIRPDGTKDQENLSGVISSDKKTIYIAEHHDGSTSGQIMGPDEIELSYIEYGEKAKAFLYHLTRKEN